MCRIDVVDDHFEIKVSLLLIVCLSDLNIQPILSLHVTFAESDIRSSMINGSLKCKCGWRLSRVLDRSGTFLDCVHRQRNWSDAHMEDMPLDVRLWDKGHRVRGPLKRKRRGNSRMVLWEGDEPGFSIEEGRLIPCPMIFGDSTPTRKESILHRTSNRSSPTRHLDVDRLCFHVTLLLLLLCLVELFSMCIDPVLWN